MALISAWLFYYDDLIGSDYCEFILKIRLILERRLDTEVLAPNRFTHEIYIANSADSPVFDSKSKDPLDSYFFIIPIIDIDIIDSRRTLSIYDFLDNINITNAANILAILFLDDPIVGIFE